MTKKSSQPACLLLWLIAVVVSGCAHPEAVHRAQTYYFADWKQAPLSLKVLRQTPVTAAPGDVKSIGQVAVGQRVEVTGFEDSFYAVNARTTAGKVKGWIQVDALEFPPAWLQEKILENRNRSEWVRSLIQSREIAVGMTPEQVQQSLGKPARIERVRTSGGEEERWVYITYNYAPHYVQPEGRQSSNQTLTYRRMPAGERVVTFRRGEVMEISADPAGTPSSEAGSALTPSRH